jgi:hypothetical protein
MSTARKSSNKEVKARVIEVPPVLKTKLLLMLVKNPEVIDIMTIYGEGLGVDINNFNLNGSFTLTEKEKDTQ